MRSFPPPASKTSVCKIETKKSFPVFSMNNNNLKKKSAESPNLHKSTAFQGH
jgi:hypothetical protein